MNDPWYYYAIIKAIHDKIQSIHAYKVLLTIQYYTSTWTIQLFLSFTVCQIFSAVGNPATVTYMAMEKLIIWPWANFWMAAGMTRTKTIYDLLGTKMSRLRYWPGHIVECAELEALGHSEWHVRGTNKPQLTT